MMSTRKLLLIFIPVAALLMVALLWQGSDVDSVSGVEPLRSVADAEHDAGLPSIPMPANDRAADSIELPAAHDGSVPGASFGADDAVAARTLGRLTGRLVDSSGKAVAREPVLLMLERDPWTPRPGRPGDNERPRQLLASAQSDAEGRFSLEAHAGARLTLLAGGATWARSTVTPVQAGEDLTVVLSEGQQLDGTVLDAASGAPVPGAIVLGLVPEDALMARTDDNGNFRLGPLPDVNIVVGAWAPGFEVKLQGDVAPSLGPLTMELPAGREIKGHVVDRVTQQPVNTGGTLTLTVDVMARMAGGEPVATLPEVLQTLTATLDSAGAFSFPPGPSMGFDIRTKAEGYVPDAWDRAETRPLGPGDDVIIALWPLGTLTGHVLREGSLVSGATVRAIGPNGTFGDTTTGLDGSFTLALDNWDGERPITLQASDSTGTLAARVRVGRMDEEQVLELVPALTLAVQVVRSGVPVVGAEVAALSKRSETTLARSGTDGLVTLIHMLAGPEVEVVRLQARHGDSQSLPLELDLTAPLQAPPLVLDLDGGAFIEGLVSDIYGTPIPSAGLTFRPTSGTNAPQDRGPDGNRDDNNRDRNNRGPVGPGGPGGNNGDGEDDDGGPAARWTTGHSDSTGHFRLGPLAADDVGTLVVRARDFRDRNVTDVAAGTAGLEVFLDHIVRWEGRVVDLASGQPLKDWYALLQREELDNGKTVFRNTRENVERKPGMPGEFSVSMPDPGRYQLRISSTNSIVATSFPVDFNGTNAPPFAVVGLSPAAVLEVTLLDARGRPVDGYSLSAVTWDKAAGADVPAGVLKGAKQERTDGAGHARFSLGEGGSYRIAAGPGHWLDGQRVDVRPGPPEKRTYTLPPTGDLEVTLTDEQGKPLAGVRVDVRSSKAEKVHSVSRQTGARTPDGKVLIEVLPPGDYDVTCRRRGYDTVKRSVLIKGNLLERLAVSLPLKQP